MQTLLEKIRKVQNTNEEGGAWLTPNLRILSSSPTLGCRHCLKKKRKKQAKKYMEVPKILHSLLQRHEFSSN